jgi:hypothetical protein
LLRKCWGVAGADIISTNLATREVCADRSLQSDHARKGVYIIWFHAINGFDHALKSWWATLFGPTMWLLCYGRESSLGLWGVWTVQQELYAFFF